MGALFCEGAFCFCMVTVSVFLSDCDIFSAESGKKFVNFTFLAGWAISSWPRHRALGRATPAGERKKSPTAAGYLHDCPFQSFLCSFCVALIKRDDSIGTPGVGKAL